MQQYAIDLRQARFRRAITGVDPEQLHALLDEAATAYEAAYADLETLRQKQSQLKEQLAQVHEAERAVSRVVVKADAVGSSARARAERQAAEVVARAEERLAEQLAPLRSQCDALRQEIVALQARRAKAAGILETAIAELNKAPATVAVPKVVPEPEVEVAPPTGPASDTAEPVDEYQFDDHDEQLTGSTQPTGPTPDRLVGTSALGAAPNAAGTSGPTNVEPATGSEPPLTATVADSTPVESVAPDSTIHQPEVQALAQNDEDSLPAVEEAELAAASDSEEADAPIVAAAPETPTSEQEREADPVETEELAPRRSRLRPTVWATGAAAVLLITAALGIPRLGALASASPSAEAAAPAEPAPTAARQAPPQASSAPPAASPATAAPAAAPASPLRVRLTALRECWVRLTVDGLPTERILPAGAELVRDAEQEVALRVGDAGAIEVEVNGVVQAPLGDDGQVVNRRYSAED